MEVFHSHTNNRMEFLVEDGKRVVTELNLWDWLRTYKPHANEGYTLDYHPNMTLIYANLHTKPSTGTEFGMLMSELKKLSAYKYTQ